MASEKLHPGAKGHALDPKRITLRIFPNGGGVPTWDAEGGVASVVRADVGKFLVTFAEGYYKPVAAYAQYQEPNDAVDTYAQLGDFNNVGQHHGAARGTPGQPTTLIVKLKVGSANSDAAATPQRCIFVDVTFEDVAK